MQDRNLLWDAATQLQVDVASDDLRCSVRLGGELDLATAARLRDALNVVCTGGYRLVVVDLGGLRFLSLTGLQVLAGAGQMLRAVGCQLVLANPDAVTVRVLAVTKLDRAFHVVEHPDVEVALGSGLTVIS